MGAKNKELSVVLEYIKGKQGKWFMVVSLYISVKQHNNILDSEILQYFCYKKSGAIWSN